MYILRIFFDILSLLDYIGWFCFYGFLDELYPEVKLFNIFIRTYNCLMVVISECIFTVCIFHGFP